MKTNSLKLNKKLLLLLGTVASVNAFAKTKGSNLCFYNYSSDAYILHIQGQYGQGAWESPFKYNPSTQLNDKSVGPMSNGVAGVLCAHFEVTTSEHNSPFGIQFTNQRTGEKYANNLINDSTHWSDDGNHVTNHGDVWGIYNIKNNPDDVTSSMGIPTTETYPSLLVGTGTSSQWNYKLTDPMVTVERTSVVGTENLENVTFSVLDGGRNPDNDNKDAVGYYGEADQSSLWYGTGFYILPPTKALNIISTNGRLNKGVSLQYYDTVEVKADSNSKNFTKYQLRMQIDNNLVEYGVEDNGSITALWSTNTSHKGNYAGHAIMQDDGNFMVYGAQSNDPKNSLWSMISQSGVEHIEDGSYLELQSDGNVVVYGPAGDHIWASNTVQSLNTNNLNHSQANPAVTILSTKAVSENKLHNQVVKPW
jgi:hypothetical protein